MKTRQGVRAALVELPGVLDVLIDGRVVFQMKAGSDLDVDKAKAILADKKVKVKSDAAIDGFRFRSQSS